MRSIAAGSISMPKCGATRCHTAAGNSEWSTQIRRGGPAPAENSIAPRARATNSARGMVATAAGSMPKAQRRLHRRHLVTEPPRRHGQQRGHHFGRIALNPDPRGVRKGRGENLLAANVPAGALEHQPLFVAVAVPAQRPHQKPHYPHQCGPVHPGWDPGRAAHSAARARRPPPPRDGGQQPGYQGRSASREVKDHARRIK